ncbi:hypothetical protein ACFX2U_01525 [Gilliamella apicola]|uniref:hypothetical protein n=1 Tax=Gilliamella apicola TaxID=1196095 RepID=UPI0039863B8F
MNIKYIFCFIFHLLLLSFMVKADVFNRQNISTITISDTPTNFHRGTSGYNFENTLIIKITADSIIIPHGFCNEKECSRDGLEIEYLGHHDIFKFVPEKYLIGSSYVNPITYDGYGSTKLEICITDGRCHSWNYKKVDDEMILFHDKLNEILSGKSKYQFHSKMIPPMPKVIFDKKNLTSINVYQLIAYPFDEVLLYTITADSITEYPFKKCYLNNGELQCEVKSERIQYQDKYNIFKAFPTLFLSGSNFVDLREYGGENKYLPLFKIKGCFNDGNCNIWDFDVVNRYHDNEAKEFLNKVKQLYYDTLQSNTKY